MMNERGKSDPAVVAAKLANKAERSVAEPVEPRAGTKGNANQQHSGRTQSQETVSQVLARIRRTARNSDLPSLTRGRRSRMRKPVDMSRSAPKVAAQAGGGFSNTT